MRTCTHTNLIIRRFHRTSGLSRIWRTYEGTVLLKNENNALPLSKDETQKLSLLGFSSYYPVQGGDMGSSLNENKGTDADTVDFVEALNAKGFGINEDLQKLLQESGIRV